MSSAHGAGREDFPCCQAAHTPIESAVNKCSCRRGYASGGEAGESSVIHVLYASSHFRAHTRTCLYAHAHTHTHTHTHTRSLTHTLTHTLTHAHTCSHTHIHTHAHTCSHTHKYTHTLTHTLCCKCSSLQAMCSACAPLNPWPVPTAHLQGHDNSMRAVEAGMSLGHWRCSTPRQAEVKRGCTPNHLPSLH